VELFFPASGDSKQATFLHTQTETGQGSALSDIQIQT
jgi:hypothetical protein